MKDHGYIKIKTENQCVTTPDPVCLKNNHVLTLCRYRKDTGDPVRIDIKVEKDGG